MVLGAHLLGAHAEEVINLFAFAIRFAIPSAELKHMIYSYPTSASDCPHAMRYGPVGCTRRRSSLYEASG